MKPWLLLFALAGCEGSSTDLIAGWTPPAAKSNELRVLSPPIRDIAPGANITFCSYLPLKIDRETDVLGFSGDQSHGGHHAIAYVARREKPVGTKECTEEDMTNVRWLAAVGAEGSTQFNRLPEGVAFRIPAGVQIMIQTHWINATLKPIDGQAVINIKTTPPSSARLPADLFTVTDTVFRIPAGQMGEVTTSCTIKQDLNVFYLGGHQHWRGTRVAIDQLRGDVATMLYDQEWRPYYESDPPTRLYSKDAPLILKKDDVMRVKCVWDNTAGATDVLFPDEMCAGFAFYYPSVGEINCNNGVWPDQSP